jgi:hypothetical protein
MLIVSHLQNSEIHHHQFAKVDNTKKDNIYRALDHFSTRGVLPVC